MSSTRELAQDLSKKIPYEPADDKILIKPLKPVMVTKELPVVDKEPKNMDEAEKTEPRFEKKKVEANIQKGVVLKVGTDIQKLDPCPYEVGDTVMFMRGAGIPFELFKDSRMYRRYELLGKVIE
jgi:co-chaperonin GroES (HSP10)